MTLAVLDTSALLAVMLNEPGADVVEAHLEGAVISAVNLAEVGAKMLERGATLELVETEVRGRRDHGRTLRRGPGAGRRTSQATHEGASLSLGDGACLALGARPARVVLTSDREWTELGLPLDIRLIR